jgi:flavin-dependent dehydrogenase
MKKKIVIVGGGTAGWITLSYLAATTDSELVIIHSNEIDPIGVGESTTPTVKHVADAVGVDEKVWMRRSKASVKYGVDFRDFSKVGARWLHTFDDMIPHQCFSRPLTENGKELYKRELSSIEYYLTHFKTGSERFNKTHGPYNLLVDNKLSPYNQRNEISISQYPGYSYHINAFEFGNSLRDHTPSDRYQEIQKKVVDIKYNDSGIEYLVLEDNSKVYGDIFVDCTGFKKLLTAQFTKWKSYTDLANNAAVWGQIKGVTSDKPVTGVWAQESGWIWEIPTWQQIGSGYVYSDAFSSEDRAVDVISNFWKNKGYKWEHFKSVKFDAGRLEEPSIKNVVSNGLSQSFIEPLEATSVMVTCVTVRALGEILNRHKDQPWSDKLSSIHSRIIKQFIDHTKKFVHFHYKLSQRDDTAYWKEVANKPGATKELCDYIDSLSSQKWLDKGETLLNQWNWTSLLLGFDKEYTNTLPEIESSRIDEYLHYTNLLQQNYEFIVGKNIPIKDWLESIHK